MKAYYDDGRLAQSGSPPPPKAIDTIDALVLLIRDLMAEVDKLDQLVRNLTESYDSGANADHKRAEGIRREVEEWRNRRRQTQPTPIGQVNRVLDPDD